MGMSLAYAVRQYQEAASRAARCLANANKWDMLSRWHRVPEGQRQFAADGARDNLLWARADGRVARQWLKIARQIAREARSG